MKLLGVEFTGFARFERQFVPLEPGITLLAGRNNAGKTALLRGLMMLNGVMIAEKHKGGDGRALQFARQQQPPRFGLDAILAVDRGEFHHILRIRDRSGAEKSLPDGTLMRLRFTAFATRLDFDEAIFFHPTSALTPGHSTFSFAMNPTVQGQTTNYVSEVWWPDLEVKNRIALPNVSMYGGANGLHPQFHGAGFLLRELEPLMNCLFIEAHRVTAEHQQVGAVTQLAASGATLAGFLHRLQVNERDKFHEIEFFVTEVFPEFRGLHTPLVENQNTTISLEDANTKEKIPLSRCGTGVEQMLVLATFVLTSPGGTVFLLDEPHSYLHPTAERQLLRFLKLHPEHRYIISTHSAVLINGVESDRVVHIAPPGQPYTPVPSDTAAILFDLGYRNSDAVFNARLVICEGESDQQIIPILLSNAGLFSQMELDRTGFARLEGIGKRLKEVQGAISRYEKLIVALRRDLQPRLYLLDGDRASDERNVIERQKNPITQKAISIAFLPRTEVENYLLVPEALLPALREESLLTDVKLDLSLDELKDFINAQLNQAAEDKKLFPAGRGEDPLKTVKGSELLRRIYQQFGSLNYEKTSGHLIAKHITPELQPALNDFGNLFRSLFEAQAASGE